MARARFAAEATSGRRIYEAPLREGLLYSPIAPVSERVDPALSPSLRAENPDLLAITIQDRVRRRAPLGQLVHRRGAAVPLLVTALGVAALRAAPGDPVDLSDIRNIGKGSWAKLIGDSDAPHLARRHVVAGVKRLWGLDLVRLKTPNSTNPGFDGWGLLTEDGEGRLYAVPRGGLTIPIDFWLNCWVQVLTPPEILTYLMIRHLARDFPASHRDDGVGAPPKVRRQSYGVTKTSYATLNELEEYGLLTRTTPRQPGTIRDDGARIVDRFRLTDDGLTKPAYETVTSVFTQNLTPARLGRYDPVEAFVRSLQ